MTDKMREEFEASVLSEYPNQNMGKFATGEYQSTTIEHCWWAWKKSREVLVIELPDEDGMQGHLWAPDVVAAIEAAGVKVKS
ncbi:hypothetical protein [Pseudomonas lundensis]|uniref:hypothetical protein n=1 Tax=Pseudomonas lundensis TaxID=86185 RepID=UPI00089DD47A|nr:hypothetical protein [Pseudomonas lundensis]